MCMKWADRLSEYDERAGERLGKRILIALGYAFVGLTTIASGEKLFKTKPLVPVAQISNLDATAVRDSSLATGTLHNNLNFLLHTQLPNMLWLSAGVGVLSVMTLGILARRLGQQSGQLGPEVNAHEIVPGFLPDEPAAEHAQEDVGRSVTPALVGRHAINGSNVLPVQPPIVAKYVPCETHSTQYPLTPVFV